jgi:hypothetical protein
MIRSEAVVRIEEFSFGRIRIDGVGYEHDVVLDRGTIRPRKKKPSKPFRDAFGHTPLSTEGRSLGSVAGSSSAQGCTAHCRL